MSESLHGKNTALLASSVICASSFKYEMKIVTLLAAIVCLAGCASTPSETTKFESHAVEELPNGAFVVTDRHIVHQPIACAKTEPVLSPEMIARGISGEVVLEATISPSGQISKIAVVSSPDESLTEASTKALRLWSFLPAVESGHAVSGRITVKFNFGGKTPNPTGVPVSPHPPGSSRDSTAATSEHHAASTLASTTWAYTDTNGRSMELIFRADGGLTVTFVSRTYRMNPSDPLGWGLPHDELKTDATGQWAEKDGFVRLEIKSPNVIEELSEKSFVDTYDGKLNAGVISGSAKPAFADALSWTATLLDHSARPKDRIPRILVAHQPEHPWTKTLATEKKIKGSATVKIHVASTGDVSEVTIVNATRKEFGESARQAISVWKFLPQIKNGEAADAVIQMTVNFNP